MAASADLRSRSDIFKNVLHFQSNQLHNDFSVD